MSMNRNDIREFLLDNIIEVTFTKVDGTERKMNCTLNYEHIPEDKKPQNLYKGEISKSGTPILPSKRARKIPEKIQVLKEDLEELKISAKPEVSTKTEESEDSDISIENLKEEEAQENTDIKEDTEATNS